MIDGERIVIAGGGVGGLALALMLGRAGRQVTLVERDRFDDGAEPDPEAAFATTRQGVPQTHQTHGFLARLRLVLRDRLPDVLADVETAGAQTLAMTRELGEPRPGDEDLAILIVRRSTLEWVLRRAAMVEPNVEIRSGVGVDGLVTSDGGDDAAVPHVVGVRLDGGDVLRGTVVACTGSRGDVPAWLAGLGVTVTEDEHRTKLVYLTRWYRLPADHPPVDLGGRVFGDLGYLRYLVVPGDGGTLSATLAVHVRDAELRARLLDEDRFDRAVRRLPGPDRFFVPGTEPIGPVRPMAGLVNRLRRFVDEGGEPLVTGFHAVGDAHTCTNPLYGRGCALAMVQAGLLADAFALHPDDPLARADAYEKASAREVEPWFHSAVQMDKLRDKLEARAARRRAAAATAAAAGEPAPSAGDPPGSLDQALDAVAHAADEATAEGVVAGAAVGREIAGSGDERLADIDVAQPGGGSGRGAAVADHEAGEQGPAGGGGDGSGGEASASSASGEGRADGGGGSVREEGMDQAEVAVPGGATRRGGGSDGGAAVADHEAGELRQAGGGDAPPGEASAGSATGEGRADDGGGSVGEEGMDQGEGAVPGGATRRGGGSDRGAAVADHETGEQGQVGGGDGPRGEASASSATGEGRADDGGGTEREEGMDQAEVAAATFGRIMAEGGSDPVIGRAIIKLFNLLALPHELMADAELLARVAPLLAKPPKAPPAPEGPSLEELLA